MNPAKQRRAAERDIKIVPIEDEVLSTEELRGIEHGRRAFVRGDYISLAELRAYLESLGTQRR